MNTEKLEKLKKSLDNKFIPDNMKDKIRVEIQKLELEIKTDDTITATEVKEEVKEIEKKVEKALEVAEKKEEQAEAKAPAKTRAKRTTTSRTKKPKVEEKPKTKKKTVFSLAKEIRKADESWDDAKLRARKMMTSQTTETKAKARTETDKLLAMVRRNKEYKKLAGTSNLSKDAQRRAMPRGKRVSKTGNVYYENRANRVDVGGFKSAYLETGGGVGKKPTLKKGDVVFVVGRRWFDRVNGNTYHTAEVFVNDKYVGKSRMTYGYDESYIQTAKEILLDSYELPKGMRDTSPLWQLREYGVTLNKTVSDGLKRDLETGGTIIGTAETPLARDLGISYTGLVGETGAMSSGEMFAGGGQITISEIKRRTSETSPYFFDAKTMKFFNQKMSDFKVRKLENGKYEIYAPRKDYNGKSMGVTKRIFNPETNELEFTKDFADGGGVGQKKYNMKFNVGKAKYVINYHDGVKKHKDGSDFYDMEIFKTKPMFDEFQRKLIREGYKYSYAEGGYLTDPNFGDFQAGIYEMGGNTGLPAGAEQSYVNYYLNEGATAGMYKKGGAVGKYVRAYYNESISNDDNGYQVNLMFYNNQDDDDYFDEEFITTNSPKEAEALADKINKEGYEKFMPKDKFAKGGGVRMVGNREYPTGRAWTNEHKHIDKADSREVNYKRKKSFDDGGAMQNFEYDDVLEVLKEKLEGAIEDLPMDYENSDSFTGEEVEKNSRDGFIAYTNGGYEVNWFEYMSMYIASGKSLPTKPLDTEMDRQVAYNYQYAKERFIEEYPEIVEELGEDNIDYNSLYDADYGDEAEQLSEWEMDFDGDDTILCEIGAYYYDTDNSRGIDEKHTIRLFGYVNLESPYHRRGNLDDSYDIDITFDSISELKEKVDAGLKEIIDWFDGKYYNDSTTEMKIRRMEEGGFMDGVYAKGGGVSPFKNMMETNTITEKEINLIKLRMNNDKVDEYTQEAIDFIWDNSPQLTSDQNKKGIDYLRNLWKSPTGKERTNNPFGYREQDALETFEYFELRGFYDAGNRYRKFYVPLYTCVGAETSFEYYISGGGINIVG